LHNAIRDYLFVPGVTLKVRDGCEWNALGDWARHGLDVREGGRREIILDISG
jgi:hypothetical protein